MGSLIKKIKNSLEAYILQNKFYKIIILNDLKTLWLHIIPLSF